MIKYLSIAALLGVSLWSMSAFAQNGPRCGPRDPMVEVLTNKYGEQFVGFGIMNDQMVHELWVNPETGSYTIVVSRSDGISCMLGAGGNWEFRAAKTPEQNL